MVSAENAVGAATAPGGTRSVAFSSTSVPPSGPMSCDIFSATLGSFGAFDALSPHPPRPLVAPTTDDKRSPILVRAYIVMFVTHGDKEASGKAVSSFLFSTLSCGLFESVHGPRQMRSASRNVLLSSQRMMRQPREPFPVYGPALWPLRLRSWGGLGGRYLAPKHDAKT